MPSHAQDGIVIEICSGNDLIEIQYGGDADKHDKVQLECPYCFLNSLYTVSNTDVTIDTNFDVSNLFSDQSVYQYAGSVFINSPRAPPLFAV